MKKILSLILACCMMVTVFPISVIATDVVASGYCGGEGDGTNLTWELDSDGTLTISGNGAMANYIFDYAPVPVDYAPWNIYCNSIKYVIIDDGVTNIGNYAFSDCSSLTSITIPASVEYIGIGTFHSCYNLKSVEIPGGVTSIGGAAFYHCENLQNIVIPASVEYIEDGAFLGCYGLTKITVDANNQYYSSDEFGVLFDKSKTTLIQYPAENSREAYIIPSGVINIQDDAFLNCNSLISIVIPDGVKNIGWYAFQSCDSLKNMVIPASVTSIGLGAFIDNNNLTSIIVDANNAAYSNDDFGVLFNKNKTSLIQYPIGNTRKTYIIPTGVTHIEYRAFQHGHFLTNVEIPHSVTNIDDTAFWNCRNLTSVTIHSRDVEFGKQIFNYAHANFEIYGYAGSTAEAYATDNGHTFVTLGIPSTATTYTRFGKYNGSTQNYVTNPTTGFGKYLMETVTIDGFTYNVADTCDQESVLLPTNYLGDYYYVAYNLNNSNEVSEAKIIPGTVCTLEGYDPATKVVDTDHFAPIVEGSTLPYGSYYVSDVTASSFPSNQIGNWVGDQVRIYCVGEQIFKVIHITEGKGEVTAYDKNNASDIVVIDGVTYAVANDGILRARISSPFENNSQYIKDAEFTMYDGTIIDLDYVNEKLDPAKFNETIYRAESLTSDINSIYSKQSFSDAVLKNGYSVSSIMVDSLGWGMHGLAFAWEAVTNTMDAVQSGPSKITDLVLEQKDMMGAYILQALKINTEVGLVDEFKTATKDVSEILGLSTDIIKSYTEQTDKYGSYSAFAKDNKSQIKDTMLQYYKDNDPQVADLIVSDKGMGILDAVIKTADSLESLYEQYIGYIKLYNLTESTKNAVNQMYESCPSSKWDIKLALGEILPVINAASEQQFNSIVTGYLTISVDYSIAKVAVDKFWDEIVDKLETKFPIMAMVFAIYNAGEYAIDQLFGTDATVEQYYKLRAIMELEEVANTSVAAIAQKYQNNSTELNASTLLDMIEIKFGLLDLDYDEAIKYSEIIHDEGAIRGFINSIKDLVSADTSNELKEVIERFEELKNEVHFEVLTDWLYSLMNDYPSLMPYFREYWAEMWNKYRGNNNVHYLDGMFTEEELQAGLDKLIDIAKGLFEHITVACPVNVFVYDSNNALVAYVKDGIIKSSDTIAIVVEGEVKNFYFYDNQQYRIVCEGYDSGNMTVIMRNYDLSGEIQRITNYNNLTIIPNTEYTIDVDIENQQILEPILRDDNNDVISPDYDSISMKESESNIEIVNGYITNQDGICFKRNGYNGEIVLITAVVPNGYIFNGWTSTNSAIEFDDANDISTSFVMVDSDVEINAVLTSVSHTITFDANGGLTSQDMDVTDDNGKLSTLPTAARNGYIFDGWYTDPVSGIKVTTSTVFTSDTTIYAHWKKDDSSDDREIYIYWLLIQLRNQKFEISATANNGGVITPDGASEVKYGNNVTYSITPDEGYAIADVVVDGESVGAVSEYAFESVKKSHTITAFFKELAWENPFDDVDEDDWFYEDIEYDYENGLMIGTSDDIFSPTEIVNRAMLVTVLWRLEGSPIVDSTVSFVDVPAGEWYTEAVNWASSNGIVNGYGDGIFGATNDLTHEQITAILNRYAVYKKLSENVSGNADDAYINSEWAENNVLWADTNGLFDGFGSDISNLTKGASRAELAAYLRRFCENVMK